MKTFIEMAPRISDNDSCAFWLVRFRLINWLGDVNDTQTQDICDSFY